MKVWAKTAFVLTLALFVIGIFAVDVDAKDTGEEKKVIMLVVDRINFEDIEDLPCFKEIMSQGSIALSNGRTSGTTTPSKAYVTIGSGVRAEGTPSTVTAVEVNGDTGEIFYRRTGIEPVEGMVVNPDINKLIVRNATGEYGAIPGNTGYYLREKGLKTAVLGNADYGDKRIRWAAAIAMDRNGVVDYGKVEQDILVEDNEFPTGYRTDFKEIISCLNYIQDKADLIVIETGDMTRVEDSRDLLSDEMYNVHKGKALLQTDEFLNEIKNRVDENKWLLLIVTPYPSSERISKGDRLTPVIAYGNDLPGGLLISDTTRRLGIIGNIDIAATVLEYFDIRGIDVIGRPVRGVPVNNNISRIKSINMITVNISNFRYPILSKYAIFVIITVLLGLVTVFYPGILRGRLTGVEKFFLIAIMIFPLVLLIIPFFNLHTLTSTGLVIVLATAGLAFIVYKFIKGTPRKIFVVSAFTTLGLVLDIVTGGHLIKVSLLGYDPIIGARYYGIGNEYMGVVIGSTLVMTASLLEKKRISLWYVAALLAVVLAAVGYPALGANVGGAITSFAAFSFFLLRLRKTKIGVRHLIVVLAGLAIVIMSFALLDMVFLKSHSHLAAAVQDAVNRGPFYLITIIHRKIAMNLKLLRYTIWTKVLITVISATAILFYRPVGIFKKIFDRYPYSTKAWSAIVVAAVVGMLVNDSGVVTSATASIFFITSLLYMLIEERDRGNDGI